MHLVLPLLVSLAAQSLRLPDDNPYDRWSFLDRADAARVAHARGLVRYAEAAMRAGRPGSAVTAIRLLGRLRAAEAVPFLVEHITFAGPQLRAVGSIVAWDRQYVAAAALGAIGGPAVNPAVAAAEASDDPARHLLTAFVLVQALGPELAADYLNRRLTALPAGDSRARVAALVKDLPTATILAMARGRNTGQDKDRPLFDPPNPLPAPPQAAVNHVEAADRHTSPPCRGHIRGKVRRPFATIRACHPCSTASSATAGSTPGPTKPPPPTRAPPANSSWPGCCATNSWRWGTPTPG